MEYKFKRSPYNQPRIIEGISVTKTGRIGLTKFLMATHGVQRGMRANMYWDADSRTVAIAFTPGADPEAYPLGFTQRYGAFINAGKFFKVHHLDLDRYADRYQFTLVSGDSVNLSEAGPSVLLIDLTEPYRRQRVINRRRHESDAP